MTLRLRIAQALLALTALAMVVLTWGEYDVAGRSGTEAVRGMNVAEGQLVIIAAVIGIGLAQLGVRPAWMAAGFAVAVMGRELLDIRSDELATAGPGLWLGLVAAALAGASLIMNMVTSAQTVSAESTSG